MLLNGRRKARFGQTTAEYAIIVALVAVASIAVIMMFGDQIRSLLGAETKQLGGDSSATNQAVPDNGGATPGSHNLQKF
jgi:Flp pilus assembly pilin Flp